MITELKLKTCTHCQDELPTGEFHRNVSKEDGLNNECKVCRIFTTRRYRIKRAAVRREYNRLYRKNNPQKVNARAAVARAIKRGSLIKPSTCAFCGLHGNIQAHHPNYNKKLLVHWLCTECHGKEHI